MKQVAFFIVSERLSFGEKKEKIVNTSFKFKAHMAHIYERYVVLVLVCKSFTVLQHFY